MPPKGASRRARTLATAMANPDRSFADVETAPRPLEPQRTAPRQPPQRKPATARVNVRAFKTDFVIRTNTAKARSLSPQRTAPAASTTRTTLVRGPNGELVATRKSKASTRGSTRSTMLASMGGSLGASGGATGSTASPVASPKRNSPSKTFSGAHYAPVPEDLRDNWFIPDRDDHDERMADTLHKRRPSDVPHPMADSPLVPAAAGFTDRAARKREGRHMKKVLTAENHLLTDWFAHGECNCEVCKPNAKSPAGAASHDVHTNKVVPCQRDHNKDGAMTSRTFDSGLVAASLSPSGTRAFPLEDHELLFTRCLGRKCGSPARRAASPGSGVLPHRSMSADALPAAGRFNQDHQPEIMLGTGKLRQPFQGSAQENQAPRSGVALVLSPRGDDPPAPTKILNDRRSDGTFKHGLTEEAAKITVRQNQEVFRFASPELVHGRNTLPPDYDSYCGLTTRGFSERFDRQHPASPKRSPRALLGANSMLMATLLNEDVNADFFRSEAERRPETDKHFSFMCNVTAEHKQTQRALGALIKETWNRNTSSNVAQHLVWEE